jgi:hypothetical protein
MRSRVKCRLAEEAAITVGVPQKAADFAAIPKSAGLGQESTFLLAPPHLRARAGGHPLAASPPGAGGWAA